MSVTQYDNQSMLFVGRLVEFISDIDSYTIIQRSFVPFPLAWFLTD